METRERLGMKKQQLFQAVEGLQDAAGEWLIARAGQRAVQGDEEEPEWLVRAGKELEQMLRQWQLQQEERLDEEQRPQQMEPESTPPNVGRQGLRVVDGAASPVVFNGFGSKLRANPPLWKQSGGRQRKLKIMQNAAARDAAAQGPQDAESQCFRQRSRSQKCMRSRCKRSKTGWNANSAQRWRKQGSWRRRYGRRWIRVSSAAGLGAQQRETATWRSNSRSFVKRQVSRQGTFTGQHPGYRAQQGQ
jgi:hypothetical protein